MDEEKQPLVNVDNELYEDNSVTTNLPYGGSQQLQNYADSYRPPAAEVQAKKSPQYVAAITATLSAVASGMVLAWTSPITSQLKNGQYNNISINSTELGWIGSAVSFGAMTTCFPYAIICDLIGRKAALLLLIIPFGVGWSLIIWAKSLLMLYCGRFITGMAAGACCVGAPLYNSEIAQKEIRGTIGGYFQIMITVGIFIAYLIGKYATMIQYTFVCAAVPFIFFILFVFQPESPLYSIKRMHVDSARRSLEYLRGVHYNIDIEIESIKIMLQNCSSGNSLTNSFKKRSTRKAFLIIFALMSFQQLCGINAIIFYTSDIFIAAGSQIDPYTATIIVGAFQVIATFASSLVVEKLGRRMLLIISELMMAVSTVCLGLFFMIKSHELVSPDTVKLLGFLPVTSLCVFIIMFSIGVGPIPWTISGEIFTPEVKSVALSSAATFNWFLSFLITKFYLQMEEQVGADVLFYAFSCLSFIGTLFCYFVVPETKGKTIEEVQRDLDN